MDPRLILKRLALPLAILAAVYMAGVVGYIVIEGWNFQDASYMTVITVATVGYGETHPLDAPGRWFTVGLILGGMGALLYSVSSITAFFVEGELRTLLRRTKMDKQIEKLSGHHVICGAGRVGSCILEELLRTGHRAVMVDQDLSQVSEWAEREPRLLTVAGDPTDDSVLEKAGIRRAAGLLAALQEDKDNLFVVLSARSLNPALRIVARADHESTRDKLLRAGADSVVFPHTIGGMRMASEMLRPNVVSFLDSMLRLAGKTLRVEEASVAEGSTLVGRKVMDGDVAAESGALLLALKHPAGGFEFNPAPSRSLAAGDVLVVMADPDQLAALKRLCSPKGDPGNA
jgi:voltage-gated potassium channel